jgi:hypothetical protein
MFEIVEVNVKVQIVEVTYLHPEVCDLTRGAPPCCAAAAAVRGCTLAAAGLPEMTGCSTWSDMIRTCE